MHTMWLNRVILCYFDLTFSIFIPGSVLAYFTTSLGMYWHRACRACRQLERSQADLHTSTNGPRERSGALEWLMVCNSTLNEPGEIEHTCFPWVKLSQMQVQGKTLKVELFFFFVVQVFSSSSLLRFWINCMYNIWHLLCNCQTRKSKRGVGFIEPEWKHFICWHMRFAMKTNLLLQKVSVK